MKPPALALLILTSFLCALLIPNKGNSQAPPQTTAWAKESDKSGTVLRALTAQLSLTPSDTVPVTDWNAVALPQISLVNAAQPNNSGIIRAWAKVVFNRKDLPAAPLAVMTENNRETVVIYLNGNEIFTNRPDTSKDVLGWNRTYAVVLPDALLNEEDNQIVVGVASRQGFNLGIGTIKIGPSKTLAAYAQSQHLKRIAGPVAANLAMLILACAALLMWFARREEEAILWLVLTAVFWFIRNYHFFAVSVPFDLSLFRDVSYYSIYFAISASLSFCVVFLGLPKARLIVISMFAAGIALSLGRAIMFQLFKNDTLVTIAALGIVVIVLGLMIRDAIRRPTLDHYVLIGVVCAIVGLSVHDMGRISNVHWWDGLGFHSQPYLGLMLFIVFSVSVGRRFVRALSLVEGLNATLEQRVEDAKHELAQSEAARRKLEVLSAVDSERERLMREMHDGIGSNLITALAIAQKQNESPVTIATLKRAISDLKITVDSLAPVEGDLVALLANFRHRIEPDLKLAGVRCVWRVEECPPLPWLDAVNALQMLRIIQEAIGNVLTHANASVLEISCRPETFDGALGITTTIGDDGVGFHDTQPVNLGHGLSNIAARAQALGGVSKVTSDLQSGTIVWVWLPLERS